MFVGVGGGDKGNKRGGIAKRRSRLECWLGLFFALDDAKDGLDAPIANVPSSRMIAHRKGGGPRAGGRLGDGEDGEATGGGLEEEHVRRGLS